MKRHLSYANIVATLALVFAMTGGAVAASSLKKNSVTSKAIKNSAVTNKKIRNNAVTSSKVKNGSLEAKDFKPGGLPAGPTGPAGSAKAFGVVEADGSVVAEHSSSNLQAREESTGRYCIKATGVAIRTIVVSLESGYSHHSAGDNEWGMIDSAAPGPNNGSCADDEALVRTFYAVTPGPNVELYPSRFSLIVE